MYGINGYTVYSKITTVILKQFRTPIFMIRFVIRFKWFYSIFWKGGAWASEAHKTEILDYEALKFRKEIQISSKNMATLLP